MYKILILAYLIGNDPIVTQQNFEMQGWFRTMDECKVELLKHFTPKRFKDKKKYNRKQDDRFWKRSLWKGN